MIGIGEGAAFVDSVADLRKRAREFTQGVLEPWTEIIDRTGEVPSEVVNLMRDQGFLGLCLPEEYGGGGATLMQYCTVLEELARSHRVFFILAQSTSGLGPTAILQFGSEDQKRKYLPDLVQGKLLAAFALSEPGAGSDAAHLSTKAELRGDEWVINGRKHFISGGDRAGIFVLIAKSARPGGIEDEITAFLIPAGAPGFSVSRVDQTIGSDAVKLAELTFENCRVPQSAVLGPIGSGFKVAMSTLNQSRLAVSCCALGAADRLLEMGVAHAKERHTFGLPLADRQAIQWMLADSYIELTAARAMTYRTIERADEGRIVRTDTGVCKVLCTEAAFRVADRIVQIFGGQGVIRGFPVERFYRDLRHTRITEGSSEVHRMVIARELLK